MKGVKLLDITQENDMMPIVNWTHWLWHLTVTKVTKMPGHWRTLEIKLEHYLSLVKGHSHNNSGILIIIDDLTAIVNILPLRKGIQERRARRWREPRFLALGRLDAWAGRDGTWAHLAWPCMQDSRRAGWAGTPAGVMILITRGPQLLPASPHCHSHWRQPLALWWGRKGRGDRRESLW